MNRLSQVTRRRFLGQASAAFFGGLAAGHLRGAQAADFPTTHEWLARAVQQAPLAMRFPGGTAEGCRRWQAEFGAKLRALLGPHSPPAKWETKVVQTADLADHRREELVLLAEGHPPLPVYLLLPRPKAAQRRAGVLALHGHGPHGHHPVAGRDDLPGVAAAIANANYDYGRQLVRRGYAVAVPCFTPFGVRLRTPESSKTFDPCADTFIRLSMLGRVLIAENLRDSLWALELLARHDEVTPERLGCVGLSYGGRMTMLTAAVEPRIRVAVISGALNVMQERISKPYSCGAQIIPGLLNYGDTPEIASLIAPRHCLWEVGSRDGLIAAEWADEALARIGRAYRALDAESRLLVDRFEGGHVFHGTVAYPLLDRVLLGTTADREK